MEFCEGIKINNVDGLKEAKLDTHEVASTLIELFSDQIFVYGFIHADPHPGNILARYYRLICLNSDAYLHIGIGKWQMGRHKLSCWTMGSINNCRRLYDTIIVDFGDLLY